MNRIAASLLLVALSGAEALSQSTWAERESPGVERSIDSLLRLMTPQEKAGQLNQLPGDMLKSGGRYELKAELKALVKRGMAGSFLNIVGAGATREVQRIAVEQTRLHIPLIFGLDVIHGYRTVFPIPIGEASSWDTGAAERAARIAASEASASGINWTFAPMVDIARDPRWGRIAEGAGEDPFLGSAMAAARVRGFQGASFDDPSTIAACAKHFAAYGAAEGGRDYNTSEISERTLREIYLPPFRAAVKAGAATLMSAFNEISGVPSSANRLTLTRILRDEWGFRGFVVSDWGAIAELQKHGIAATPARAASRAITAGVDMDMAGELYAGLLPELVKTGKVSSAVVDEAVRRVLRVKFALGLFRDPYRNCRPELEPGAVLPERNVAAARKIACESMVLLKNEHHLLPLRKAGGTLAVVGPLAASHTAPLGPWRGEGRPENVVSVWGGIMAAVSPTTRLLYASGCDSTFSDTAGFADAVRAATIADAVILVAGETAEMSGEAASRSDIRLPGVQEELAKRVVATGKPVVLVLLNGRPLCIPWEADHAAAILEAWFPGVEAGHAVADLLFGEANPSGKLPVTFPRSVGQIPLYYSHKNSGRPFDEKNHYTSKYLDIANTPLFEFGEGLSYNRYSYSRLNILPHKVSPHGEVNVSVVVTNDGTRSGDEIVELYVHDDEASVTRPVKELKGFRRIALAPGESKKVEFSIKSDDLGFYDESMNYIVEPGSFTLFVGGSPAENLRDTFEISGE